MKNYAKNMNIEKRLKEIRIACKVGGLDD